MDRKRLAIAGAAVLTCMLLWFGVMIGPGLIWPGISVIERCDVKAKDRFGDNVFAVRGAERISWWTPGWECPLTNGETVRP